MWCSHATHGQGLIPFTQSPLVLGLGIASSSLIASVLLELVDSERMGSCSKAAVLLASAEDASLGGAPARSDDAGAGRLGMVGVAASGVGAGASSLERVSGSQ